MTDSPSLEAAAPAPAPDVAPTVPAAEQEQGVNESDADFAKRMAILTRRERMLTERERSLKDHQKAVDEWRREKELVKTNPAAFLEKQGMSFKDLADFVLNDNKETPEQRIARLEKALEEERTTRVKQKEEEVSSRNEAQINAFKAHIRTFTAGKDEFEIINSTGNTDMVYDVIFAHHQKTGQMLPIDKAAQEVEKYLEQEYKKILGLKRFAPKTPQSDTPGGQTPGEQTRADMKPLTNDQLTAVAPTTPSKSPYLSDEESKKEAAKLLTEYWQKRRSQPS